MTRPVLWVERVQHRDKERGGAGCHAGQDQAADAGRPHRSPGPLSGHPHPDGNRQGHRVAATPGCEACLLSVQWQAAS